MIICFFTSNLGYQSQIKCSQMCNKYLYDWMKYINVVDALNLYSQIPGPAPSFDSAISLEQVTHFFLIYFFICE